MNTNLMKILTPLFLDNIRRSILKLEHKMVTKEDFKPYFEDDYTDFESPDEPGSWQNMDYEFIYTLMELRKRVDLPFIITSGYRSKRHNKKVGGVEGSSHRKGYAVDIKCTNGYFRLRIIKEALALGIRRIGVSKNFIHIDIDPDKPDSIWTY